MSREIQVDEHSDPLFAVSIAMERVAIQDTEGHTLFTVPEKHDDDEIILLIYRHGQREYNWGIKVGKQQKQMEICEALGLSNYQID